VVTWSTILGGCAVHGHGKEALKYFEQMCEEGVQPNDITVICLLSACSHAGLVDEGMCFYAAMVTDYMISPKFEHYTCMLTFLAMLTIYRNQRIWSWECPGNHMWLHAWLCLALAEFMVMWRWQNVLPNEFLKWSLTMLLVTWCCQTSILLLVTGISVRMLNGRGQQEV
jgi:pentatricopeptide repeat protein